MSFAGIFLVGIVVVAVAGVVFYIARGGNQ